jgi:hypothetical protein
MAVHEPVQQFEHALRQRPVAGLRDTVQRLPDQRESSVACLLVCVHAGRVSVRLAHLHDPGGMAQTLRSVRVGGHVTKL